jgi:HSP20 family molecular chaperone IbpA
MSHRTPYEEEDLYDITTAASVAEAEMLETANAERAKIKEAAAQTHPTTSGKDTTTTTTTTTTTNPPATAFPPVDIFASPSHWTLHFSLAGAKKGDVAVAWDEGMAGVVVRGVVNLPGGGEQVGLGSLVASERRVGGFERVVEVPPVVAAGGEGGEKGEGKRGGKGGVDGRGVESWLEDGVLVVRVPKKGAGGE